MYWYDQSPFIHKDTSHIGLGLTFSSFQSGLILTLCHLQKPCFHRRRQLYSRWVQVGKHHKNPVQEQKVSCKREAFWDAIWNERTHTTARLTWQIKVDGPRPSAWVDRMSLSWSAHRLTSFMSLEWVGTMAEQALVCLLWTQQPMLSQDIYLTDWNALTSPKPLETCSVDQF